MAELKPSPYKKGPLKLGDCLFCKQKKKDKKK